MTTPNGFRTDSNRSPFAYIRNATKRYVTPRFATLNSSLHHVVGYLTREPSDAMMPLRAGEGF